MLISWLISSIIDFMLPTRQHIITLIKPPPEVQVYITHYCRPHSVQANISYNTLRFQMLFKYSGVNIGRHEDLKSLWLPVALKELIIFLPCLNVHPPAYTQQPENLLRAIRSTVRLMLFIGKLAFIKKKQFFLQGMIKKRKRQAWMPQTD